MAVTVMALGPLRMSGGALFVAIGPANQHFQWSIFGNGTLTPIETYSNANGVAACKWAPDGSSAAGDTVVVTATTKT